MTANNEGCIQRSRVLADPLRGRASLLREIGAFQDHGAVFDAWARNLRHRLLWPLPHNRYSEVPNISTFIHDEATQDIVAARGRSGQYTYSCGSIAILDKHPDYHMYRQNAQDRCPGSIVTSISLSLSRMMLTTTRQERQPSSLYPMPLAEIAIDVYPRLSLFAKRLLPNPTGTYWASAANPVPDVCNFAIGASNGSFILRDINCRWFLERNPNLQGQGEAVAIDWLGPRVVLKGCGEGSVRLWDLRSRGEGTEPRIQHRTGINHLRRIDENMVVVAGLRNELCTYDLRYAKRISANGPTQHYDKFPTYRNTMLGHISTGLDVHRNLVAATTDDRRVQIFDVKKGVELVSGIRNLDANAASVRFVDEQRSGNGLKLLVASGPKIDSYGFEDSEQRWLWDRDEVYHCPWSRD